MQKSTAIQLLFSSLGRLQVIGKFNGGDLSSDGGIMLLREVDRLMRLTERVAACFIDHRNPNSVVHDLPDLIRQRVYGLCQGYEDLIDHQRLRTDPAFALALERLDGNPLASAATLSRLELSRLGQAAEDRYRRIEADFAALENLLVDLFLDSLRFLKSNSCHAHPDRSRAPTPGRLPTPCRGLFAAESPIPGPAAHAERMPGLGIGQVSPVHERRVPFEDVGDGGPVEVESISDRSQRFTQEPH